jgi:hypothetical protein
MKSVKYKDSITIIIHFSQEDVVFETDLLYDVIRINSKFCNRKKIIHQFLLDQTLFHKVIEGAIRYIWSVFRVELQSYTAPGIRNHISSNAINQKYQQG